MNLDGLTERSLDPERVRRRVRLLLLLNASREAGLEPVPTLRLHLAAYLSYVLAPVWDMRTNDGDRLGRNGSVLKQRIGPFYPDLQTDLDMLVGIGVAKVERLRYQALDTGGFRLEGCYRINREFAQPILDYVGKVPHEARNARHIRELVLALSALGDEELDAAASQDATFSDRNVGVDNVIDFGEWASTNYSASAALRVGTLVNSRVDVGASERVHLYIRHLRRRLQGAL